MKSALVGFCFACLALAITSCGPGGPKKMKAWGNVTFNGVPIDKGTITFLPIPDGTQGTATGGEIMDGNYEIAAATGPIVGLTYKVEIKAMRKTGKIPNPFNAEAPPLDKYEDFVPEKYNFKSGLKVTIGPTDADNKHDFHLKSE